MSTAPEGRAGKVVPVVRAEVTTLEEVGITCDAVNCDLLEIKLDIREVFKGTADDYVSIHAAVPTMCFVPIVAGWEYVLFLEEFVELQQNHLLHSQL